MTDFGAYGKGVPAPSSPSSNLSASAPPFTIGQPVPYYAADPFVNLTSDSYDSSLQYAALAHPLSLSVEPPTASIQYSVTDTFYGMGGPSQHNAYPVSSSQNSGFSLYSNNEFSLIPSSNPAAEYSCWNPLGTSFSAYMYGGQCSEGVTSNPVEAGAYCPPYVPPSLANHGVPSSDLLPTFHMPPLNGPFLGEYNPNSASLGDKCNDDSSNWRISDSKGAALKESPYSFYSMKGSSVDSFTSQNYVNQGTHSSDVLKTCEGIGPPIGIFDNDKPFTSARTEQSDGGNILENSPTCMLPIHSNKNIVCSFPAAPEPVWQSQCLKRQGNHGDVQVGESTSNMTWTHQPNSRLACKESSFDLNMELTSDCSDIQHMNISHTKSSGPLSSSGGSVQFEAPQLDRQLEWNDHAFAALSPTYNSGLYKGLPNPGDEELHGFHGPFGNWDRFKVGFNFDGVVQPVHHYSENLDKHNPAIDSPCWKGISFRNVSPFGASDVVGTQLIKETEICNSLNFLGPNISKLDSESTMEGSSQKSNKRIEFLENDHVDNVIAPLPCGNSITESLPRKYQSDDEEKASSHSLKDGDCFALSTDNPRYRNGDYTANESFNGSGCESSDRQQGLGEGVLTAEKEDTAVHAPILSSSLPVSNISSKLCNLGHKDLMKDIYVQRLIEAMCNLSELLLIHCSRHTCEINEEDTNRLKQVISNLTICRQRESSKEQATFQHNKEVRESDRPFQSQSEKLQQVKKAVVDDDEVQLNDNDTEEKKHNDNFGMKNLKLNSVPVTFRNVDMANFDEVTRAIKKVLIENFYEEETHAQSLMYKNLWLEAEAELCSTNFKTRCNRIKSDMEKFQLNKDTEDVSPLEDLERSAVSPKSIAAKFAFENGNNITSNHESNRHLDEIRSKFHILGGGVDQSLADCTPDVAMLRSKAYNLYRENGEKLETSGHQNLDSANCELFSESRECHTDNVMARSQCQDDSPIPGVDLSRAKESADLNRENQMALKSNRHTASDMAHCNSLLLNSGFYADDVLARFDILKCRGETTVYEDSLGSSLSSPKMNRMARTGCHPPSDITNYGSSIRSQSCLDDDMSGYLSHVDLSVSGHSANTMPSIKVSSDISKEYQIAQGTGGGSASDVSYNSFADKDTNRLPDNVMAKFNILTCRYGGSVSKDTPNQVALGTGSAPTSDVTHPDFSAENTRRHPDDVMAKLKILPSKGGQSISGNTPNKEEMSSSNLKDSGLEEIWNDCSIADVQCSESSIEDTNHSVYDNLTKSHALTTGLDPIAESTTVYNIDENSGFEILSNLNNIMEVVAHSEARKTYSADTGCLLEKASQESGTNKKMSKPSGSSAGIKLALEVSPRTQYHITDRRFKQMTSSLNEDSLSDWEIVGEEELPCQMAGTSSQ